MGGKISSRTIRIRFKDLRDIVLNVIIQQIDFEQVISLVMLRTPDFRSRTELYKKYKGFKIIKNM